MTTDLDTIRPAAGGLAILSPRTGRDDRPDFEDALATISAGYREGEGNAGRPAASRDGTIYLHDPDRRAPGLADALKGRGGKALTVAFLADDPERIVSQRFMSYSASRLVAYGDEQRITWIKWLDEQDEKKGFERVVFERGTDEYEKARAKCKTYASVYFALARYDDDGQPEVLFPDGLGYYRLRTTSLNSLRILKSNLEGVRRLTGGRLRGIPFELTIGYREVARPNGRKTRIPVWQAVFRPPSGIVLGSRSFRQLAIAGLQQGRMLALPPATDALLADEAVEEGEFAELPEQPEVDEPSEAEVGLLARGGRCNAAYWKQLWGALADGTRYDDEEERHRLVFAATKGRYASLRAFLDEATDAEAATLLERLKEAIAADRAEPEAQDGEWAEEGARGEPDPAPMSDDEMLAGMARRAVHAFLETFRGEDGDKPPSAGLKRAWARFLDDEMAREWDELRLALLPRLLDKGPDADLTAAEMRALMAWGGAPDAPDHIAALSRLHAAVPF